jgi:hypothetical protein
MEKESDEAKKQQLAWALKGLDAEKNPMKLDEKSLQAYVGVYGPRKIWLEDGALYYQRTDRPKYKLAPMGDDTFMVEGLEYFRIKFNKDAAGKVTEFVGMYDNGTTDSNPRTDK